jgi:AcrR family transcriptional regulator
VRRPYHIDMDVSRQSATMAKSGPRARTRRLMLETATKLMQQGTTPSVSDVAEAAGVSRATAYRYFASQAALVQAVVDEALGPILNWQSDSDDSQRRLTSLLDAGLPRIDKFEATFKAALKLSLDHWAQNEAGTLGLEPAFARGHRKDLLLDALSPSQNRLKPAAMRQLAQATSLFFGIEALVVLKDIWGLDRKAALNVCHWAADALLTQALAEAESGENRRRTRKTIK